MIDAHALLILMANAYPNAAFPDLAAAQMADYSCHDSSGACFQNHPTIDNSQSDYHYQSD